MKRIILLIVVVLLFGCSTTIELNHKGDALIVTKVEKSGNKCMVYFEDKNSILSKDIYIVTPNCSDYYVGQYLGLQPLPDDFFGEK